MIKRSMRWILAGVAVAAAAFVIGAVIEAVRDRAEDIDTAMLSGVKEPADEHPQPVA